MYFERRNIHHRFATEAASDNPGPTHSLIGQVRRDMHLDDRSGYKVAAMKRFYNQQKAKSQLLLGDRGLDNSTINEITIPDYLHDMIILNE